MTLLELEDLCLSWLDDPNASYYTRPQLKVWINNAQREVQRRLIKAGENYYEVPVSTQTVMNISGYSLPSDFLKCHKLAVVLNGTGVNENIQIITPTTLVQLGSASPLFGVPVQYTIRNNCLLLDPAPNDVYTLKMIYSPKVSNMSADTDVPAVPDTYTELIAVLATLDGYLKDKTDPSNFITEKRDYYMKSIEQDMKNRQIQSPRMVVQTEDYGYGVLY